VPAVTLQQRWAALVGGDPRPGAVGDTDRPLVDIGSSIVTGVRDRRDPATRSVSDLVGHPVQQTRVLGAAGARAAGSDFLRAGFVHPIPALDEDGGFVDPLGVRWLWCAGEPAPLVHPLADADAAAIRQAPAPVAPPRLVAPGPRTGLLTVADAPAPGLVEFCAAARGLWQFLEDVTDNRPAAAALLDRALAVAVEGYDTLLAALPATPDLVIYADDLGYGDSMFLAGADYRDLVAPRLRELVATIRGRTAAPLAVAATGAIAPILPDLLELGVELLNVQHDARGMDPGELRRTLPAATVLHGVTDLVALGRAIAERDLATVANGVYQFARCWPVVVAPAGSLDLAELPDAVTAGIFLSALTGEDVALVRRAGPVRSIVMRCLDAVRDTEVDLRAVAGDPHPDVAPVTSP
jgi:hypothetical protein